MIRVTSTTIVSPELFQIFRNFTSQIMNIAKLFLILLSSSIFTCIVKSKCIDQQCNKTNIFDPVIQFPFRVIQQPKECGYPGFDLHCNGQTGKPVLELPNSVFLDVDSIFYSSQEITLSDPSGCIPSKLFNLDLSISPFYSKYYLEFAVFNCSGNFPVHQFNLTTNYDLNKIRCLSGLNYTVYAVDTYDTISLLTSSSSCQRSAANMVVPVDIYYPTFGFPLYDGSTISLYWDEPRCGPCNMINRRCQVRPGTASEAECTSNIYGDDNESSSRQRLTVGLAVGIPLLVVVVAGLMVSVKYGCWRNESATPTQRSITTRLYTTDPAAPGIDQTTIDSYPRFVIGESGRLIVPHDNTCPICLSEYRISQVLVILPYCQHRFHADCIDQWLAQNGTCPVCRVPPPRG